MTDEPVRGRVRAGNNMSRSRAGILAGAARCLVALGTRKTTMADIAREGGVAKATLYNHFRTKAEVWAALAEVEIGALVADIAALPAPVGTADAVRDAAALAAERAAGDVVVRALAEREPELLALALRPDAGSATEPVRRALAERVAAAQSGGALDAGHDAEVVADALLRWAASYAYAPVAGEPLASVAHALVRGFADPPYARRRAAPASATPATPAAPATSAAPPDSAAPAPAAPAAVPPGDVASAPAPSLGVAAAPSAPVPATWPPGAIQPA